MSALSQYQSVFRIAKHDTKNSPNNATQSRAQKRNRRPVSCAACRTRKLKCDRQLPCIACMKRGDAEACYYSNSHSNGHTARDEGLKTSEAQLRLQKLEQMVASLMQTVGKNTENGIEKTLNSAVDHSTTDTPAQSLPQEFETSSGGHLDTNGSETSYAGPTHWTTILQNIRDIQGVLESDAERVEETLLSSVSDDSDILCGTTQSLTLAEAYKSLPPKPVVDKLLSTYFTEDQRRNPIIHSKKFLREVDAFWAEPSRVSLLWVSMLFSALWLASQIKQPPSQDGLNFWGELATSAFFTKAGQALVAGKYNKARPYSVEAVLLYGQCQYMQEYPLSADSWMTMGIGIRLAVRMGYHRDPRHLAKVSPFEGEMRRRTFSILTTFDLLLSFQAGLPPTIREDEYDTEPPSNLFDEDFDEDCKSLPPSKPPTEPTPMLYYQYKCRFAALFGRVIRHALSPKIPSYDDTMKLDAELHEMHENIPPSLKIKALSRSFSDQTQTIVNRLNIELFYLKCLCVLHRTFLSHERSNTTFDYSRKTCVDAALQMLDKQEELLAASRPGGRFMNEGWVVSSFTLHDFFMAAMIVCLDLYENHTRPSTTSPEDRETQGKKYDALRLCHDFWIMKRVCSPDAARASKVLAAMLSKIPRPNTMSNPVNTSQQLETAIFPLADRGSLMEEPASNPGTLTWDTTACNISAQEYLAYDYNTLDFSTPDPLDTIFSESDNIDWGVLDQCLLDPGYGGDLPMPGHL